MKNETRAVTALLGSGLILLLGLAGLSAWASGQTESPVFVLFICGMGIGIGVGGIISALVSTER